MRSFANCFLGLVEDLYKIKSRFRLPEVVKRVQCFDQILKNGHFLRSLAIFSRLCDGIWLKIYIIVECNIFHHC